MKRRSNPKDVRALMRPQYVGIYSRTENMTVRDAVAYGLPLTMRQILAIEAAIGDGVKIDAAASDYADDKITWSVRAGGLLRKQDAAKSLMDVGFFKVRYRGRQIKPRYTGEMTLVLDEDGTVI